MTTWGANESRCCAVLELRQYTLKPDQRNTLVNLFDRHFIESQEAAGMTVVGQFRDRGRSDRFVWLRGFSDMESRRTALAAFYEGPVWAAHRVDANNTMVDSDDVLLLRPARPDLAFRGSESLDKASEGKPVTVLAGIYQLAQAIDEKIVARFERQVVPALQSNGIHLEGVFVTEPAPNTYPKLPVREGEHVLVWIGTFDRQDAASGWLERLVEISPLEGQRATILDLEPTSRSILGRGPNAARATKHDFDFLFGSWKVHNRYLIGRLR